MTVRYIRSVDCRNWHELIEMVILLCSPCFSVGAASQSIQEFLVCTHNRYNEAHRTKPGTGLRVGPLLFKFTKDVLSTKTILALSLIHI